MFGVNLMFYQYHCTDIRAWVPWKSRLHAIMLIYPLCIVLLCICFVSRYFLFWCVLSVGEKQKALSSIIIYRATEILVTVTTRADFDDVNLAVGLC